MKPSFLLQYYPSQMEETTLGLGSSLRKLASVEEKSGILEFSSFLFLDIKKAIAAIVMDW